MQGTADRLREGGADGGPKVWYTYYQAVHDTLCVFPCALIHTHALEGLVWRAYATPTTVACMPRPARARRSRHLRATLSAAPVPFAHASVHAIWRKYMHLQYLGTSIEAFCSGRSPPNTLSCFLSDCRNASCGINQVFVYLYLNMLLWVQRWHRPAVCVREERQFPFSKGITAC